MCGAIGRRTPADLEHLWGSTSDLSAQGARHHPPPAQPPSHVATADMGRNKEAYLKAHFGRTARPGLARGVGVWQ